MVEFIFYIIIFMYILLIISFYNEIYILLLLSSLGIAVLGVSLLSEGAVSIENIVTVALGTISFGVGFYVFLRSTVEKIQEDI